MMIERSVGDHLDKQCRVRPALELNSEFEKRCLLAVVICLSEGDEWLLIFYFFGLFRARLGLLTRANTVRTGRNNQHHLKDTVF
jgi:hypothetical protein